jgi:hypothetical protein
VSGWVAVLAACAVAFGLKLAGHLVPRAQLERPTVVAVTGLLPVALLAALVAVQALGAGQSLALDARAAGVAAAVTALLLRAPFLVVITVAGVVAAGLRALGWAA